MGMLEKIYEKAKQNPVKVAFPEASNEKMMQAAYETGKEGYIIPVLVGPEEELRLLAGERGYDPSVFTYADTQDEARKNAVIANYVALPDTRLKEKALARRMENPLYFAMAMQKTGEVGVTFAGIDNTTGDVLLAGQMMIGLMPGISTVSSIGICDIPGFEGGEDGLLAIGDSAVCTNPTARQLADIAISACETVESLLGWDARCAMVSYSTLGSGQGELVDKVVDAVRIAKEERPDLAIDGEFQFDAAVNPAVAAKKVKRESAVAGRANVVIWPDLNVGNVGVKLIQQFGHADAYGPMLQGFDGVICDCSRGAPVSEIKGNIIISAVRAAGLAKGKQS
ncbi:MAG: phosphate acetyltransferase [Lachnospiraceae bacterium]|nr:phosphate acetyltransferase [Lachnospiraceae bacterium]